jgi:hypothetical protein
MKSLHPPTELLRHIDSTPTMLRRAKTLLGEIKMDLQFLSLIVACFALTVLLVYGCEKLRRPS